MKTLKVNNPILGTKDIRPAMRKAITEKVNGSTLPVLEELGFEYVADKKAYVIAIEDNAGTVAYFTLTATVGLKHPSDKSEKKHSSKKSSTEIEEIVFD